MSITVTVIPTVFDVQRLIPIGNVAITFFVEACPDGWSEYTGLRGRYPVGVPSGGTILGTVGTAMSNSEARAVGQHTHTFSGAALSAHGHVFAGDALGTHTHKMRGYNSSSDNNVPTNATLSNAEGGSTQLYRQVTPNVDMRAGSNTSDSGGTPAGTNATTTGGTPAGTNANSGSVASTNAPYIQLVPCTKD